MTKNIKALYSIRFKLNAGLIYSIASCYIYSLIIFDMLSFIQMDLCRISGGQTGVSITSWHKNSLLMYILHQEGFFLLSFFYRLVQIYFIVFYFIDLLNCQNQLSVSLLLYCNKYYACDCKKCYTYECKPTDWCACIACIYAI